MERLVRTVLSGLSVFVAETHHAAGGGKHAGGLCFLRQVRQVVLHMQKLCFSCHTLNAGARLWQSRAPAAVSIDLQHSRPRHVPDQYMTQVEQPSQPDRQGYQIHKRLMLEVRQVEE